VRLDRSLRVLPTTELIQASKQRLFVTCPWVRVHRHVDGQRFKSPSSLSSSGRSSLYVGGCSRRSGSSSCSLPTSGRTLFRREGRSHGRISSSCFRQTNRTERQGAYGRNPECARWVAAVALNMCGVHPVDLWLSHDLRDLFQPPVHRRIAHIGVGHFLEVQLYDLPDRSVGTFTSRSEPSFTFQ